MESEVAFLLVHVDTISIFVVLFDSLLDDHMWSSLLQEVCWCPHHMTKLWSFGMLKTVARSLPLRYCCFVCLDITYSNNYNNGKIIKFSNLGPDLQSPPKLRSISLL